MPDREAQRRAAHKLLDESMRLGRAALCREEGLIEEAFELYFDLATEGNKAAQADLAMLPADSAPMAVALGDAYLLGDKGLSQHYGAARRWFQVAAKAGDPSAMAKFGCMLDLGLGGEADLAESFRWLQEAACRGEQGGHYGLAVLHGDGRGVPRNPSQALVHLLVAGIDDDVLKKNFERLQAELTEAQIVEVNMAAEGWRAQARALKRQSKVDGNRHGTGQ